jgi:extradiol dioxygenase family protein
MASLSPFHLAIPVRDLEEARDFYTRVLGCGTGREDTHWIDFDMYGHQVVAHLHEGMEKGIDTHNQVDGENVPVPHFGIVLDMESWESLSERLQAEDSTRWVIEPGIRFVGLPGEQATMFILDPSGNALEFKAFKDIGQLFAKWPKE